MVLLHHHVVPGLGNDSRPNPEATAVREDQAPLAGCDDVALMATLADPAIPSPPVDTIRAA